MNNLKFEAKDGDFNCETCEEKFSSIVKLKVHVKLVHYRNSSSQTELKVVETRGIQTIDDNTQPVSQMTISKNKYFEKYSCYYCGEGISSESQLTKHTESCHGTGDRHSLFSLRIRFPTSRSRSIQSQLIYPFKNSILLRT